MPLVGQSAHNNAIFDLTWSPADARRLVTVSGDQRACLWDLGQAQLLRYLLVFNILEPHDVARWGKNMTLKEGGGGGKYGFRTNTGI
jgi:WD40 repeat protein